MREEPLEYKHEADVVLERAAERLRRVLQEAAARLDPFPPFPGAFFSYGIEIEAPGAAHPDLGCVVLAPDGELYELRMGQELPLLDLEMADPVALRKEELKPLELHPRDYVNYAYHAIAKVVELLLEQQLQGSA
ncbi:MAG: hypothetical protein E6I38_11740 [Chloroflexi bacterium]|nr:MAG: hypothetical protein E6I38_11740 [Chloroflexota bacterium]